MEHPGALTQPPYDTSLLGVAVGALYHYGNEVTPGEAFVLSGHAFALNIHPDLCPSAPYCWDYRGCVERLRNVGLETRELGTLMPTADAAAKRRLESRVREALEQGAVCSLLNLDHQLVLGRDEEGFLLAQPWGPEPPSTPKRLTFGTWEECQTGPPVEFFAFMPCEPASSTPLEDALAFAVDAWKRPESTTEEPYWFRARGLRPLARCPASGRHRCARELVERLGLGRVPCLRRGVLRDGRQCRGRRLAERAHRPVAGRAVRVVGDPPAHRLRQDGVECDAAKPDRGGPRPRPGMHGTPRRVVPGRSLNHMEGTVTREDSEPALRSGGLGFSLPPDVPQRSQLHRPAVAVELCQRRTIRSVHGFASSLA